MYVFIFKGFLITFIELSLVVKSIKSEVYQYAI